MKSGVYVPTSGEYDVRALARLAREVEESGWDGLFVWDNMLATFDGTGVLDDVTIALAAIALSTERIRFGPLVTPLARRRPWKVAKEMATLDRLSGGRLVLGVGLGGDWDFALLGEIPSGPGRAEMLDESLALLTAFWTGEDVFHQGTHFTVHGARVVPRPVQQPRIPVWMAGYWPGAAPFRRAARWDGVAPVRAGHLFKELEPCEVADCLAYISAHRDLDTPFDLVTFNIDPCHSRSLISEYEQAGATWWLESTNPANESLAEFRRRVRAGPPR